MDIEDRSGAVPKGPGPIDLAGNFTYATIFNL